MGEKEGVSVCAIHKKGRHLPCLGFADRMQDDSGVFARFQHCKGYQR